MLMKERRASRAGRRPPARRLAVAALALAAWTAGTAGAQAITLQVTKGASQDVALHWSATAGMSSFEVRRDVTKSMPGSTMIGRLCGFDLTDPGALAVSDPLFYTVDPWFNPNGPVADAGPDLGSGATIGGSPAASGGSPPYTYNWAPPDGLSDPAAANPRATPAATTTYTLTVTDSLGCAGRDEVIVSSGPPALIAEAGPDQRNVVCGGGNRLALGGDPLGIGATASGGTGPYSFSWTPLAGLDDTSKEHPTLIPFDNGAYTVTVTDALMNQAADTVNVKVYKGLAHCLGFGNYASPPGYCATDFTLDDDTCTPWRLHDNRCKVIVLLLGRPA